MGLIENGGTGLLTTPPANRVLVPGTLPAWQNPSGGPGIQTINSVAPSLAGDFEINAGSGIAVIPGANSILLSVQSPLPVEAGLSGQVLTSNGPGKLPTWKGFSISTQVFTKSGTYTPTPGMVSCIIECVGSGGGGGGTVNSSLAYYITGGGGGGGSYSRKFASAAVIGNSQIVTVGNEGGGGSAGVNNGTDGNDVSVGTICVGKGGRGGAGNNGKPPLGGIGGMGGTGGIGDFSIPGQGGFTDMSFYMGGSPKVGYGGSSLFGFGGSTLITNIG